MKKNTYTPNKLRPWYGLYKNYVSALELDSKLEKKWAYRLSKQQYKIQTSKGIKKALYISTNWFLATAIIGNFGDKPATKFEKITNIPKKTSQDWNVAWSCIDHIALLSSGMHVSSSEKQLSEIIITTAEKSLDITFPIAVICTLWAGYRLLNRDEKARPSLGYGSLAAHIFYYSKTSKKDISRLLNSYTLQAKKEGLPLLHTITKQLIKDSYMQLKNIPEELSTLKDYFY
jgi:hypothetical protein